MIGFCFLTYDEIEREDIWNKYFQNISKSKYKIFTHAKNPKNILQQELFKSTIIPEHIETKWANFSLVTAQTALFANALKTNEITHSILLSHNSIPLQSFDKLYDYIKNRGSLFGYCIAGNHHRDRYHTLNNPEFPKENFYFQSQWCAVDSVDMKLLVNNHEKIKEIFEKSSVPDEHAYINYLINYENREIVSHDLSKMYWHESRPKVFDKIDNKFIDDMHNWNHFFLRKVTKNTTIDIDYMLK